MKKSLRKYVIGSTVAAFGLIVSAMSVAILKNSDRFSRMQADNEYTLTLNYNNGGSSFANSYSSTQATNTAARNNSGWEIDVAYVNAKKATNYYVDLAGTGTGAGYIYNTSKITGISSIKVTFSGSLSLYTSDTTSFGDTGTSLTSDLAVELNGSDNYFKILNVSASAVQISQIVVKYTCVAAAKYYEKVTSGTVENGQYLIVYETGNKAFDGSLSNLDSTPNTVSVTISDDKIAKSDTLNAALFTFEAVSGGYSIQSSSGKYIGRATDKNGLESSTEYSSNYLNTVSFSDGNVVIAGTSGRQIGFNTATDQLKFRYMSSTAAAVQLYKASSSSGGGSVTPESGTYEVTIEKANSGLSTSASTTTLNKTWTLSDGLTDISATWGAGAYNYSSTSDNRFRTNKDSYLQSNCSVVVKEIFIDFSSSNPFNYVTVKANGNAVEGTETSRTAQGNGYDFAINSNNWIIEATNGYVVFYSITIYCEINYGPVSVTGVSLNKSSLELVENESETLIATITPTNATNKNMTWTSSNSSIASVDASGNVSGVAHGSATITVKTEDGNYSASCSVTVIQRISVTGVSLNKTNESVYKGSSVTLTATVSPSNASNKSVTWSSANETIATVNNGVVSGNAVGTTTITVTTVDGNKAASCTVEVKAVPVSGITLSESSKSIKVGQTFTLEATISPDSAEDKVINWSTSDASVASLSATTGSSVTVTGASASEDAVTITATTHDGSFSDSCSVTVIADSTPVAGSEFELVNSLSDLSAGDYVVLGCSAQNAVAGSFNSTYLTSVSATISDEKVTLTDDMMVFEVGTSGSKYTFESEDGLLGYSSTNLTFDSGTTTWDISISSGTLTMTGGSNPMRYNNNSPRFRLYSGATNMSTVQFYKQSGKVNGVSLDASDIGLNVGSTYTLHASVTPASALNKNVSWSSSNTTYAEVNSEGVVTAKAAGNATITVTTQDGSFQASCLVRVTTGSSILPAELTLNKTASEMLVGETLTLQGTIKPQNVDNSTLTWTSSNTSVATVSSSGVVTAKTEGNTTITAKTVNNISATCNISVVEEKLDAWTIMIYLCGSDLESDNGFATSDITEILSVAGQPDDVNIIIETGGSTSWDSTYGIEANKIGRYHVENKQLVADNANMTNAAMGDQSTFESFLNWGLTSYPAEKTGVILWNHGGAMRGVCYDRTTEGNDDPLLNSETKGAFNNVLGSKKLEFIGYDACLMQVQDIADANSNYFNYMVASEESEAGEGWAYSGWLDKLYDHENNDTETILGSIATSFISAYDSNYPSYDNDQTLSVLDLSKMSAYKSAMEALASSIGSGIASYGKTGTNVSSNFYLYARRNIKNFGTSVWTQSQLTNPNYGGYSSVSQSETYGVDHIGNYYYDWGANYFGIFDALDFLNKVNNLSAFSLDSTKLNAAKTALNNLVISNEIGAEAGNCCGICIYFPTNYYCSFSTYYSSDETAFSSWRSMVNSHGSTAKA